MPRPFVFETNRVGTKSSSCRHRINCLVTTNFDKTLLSWLAISWFCTFEQFLILYFFFNNNKFYNHCHLYNPNFAGHCSKRLKYGDICKFSQKCQGRCCFYPDSTGEETEGYGGGGSRPQAPCQLVAESGFGSKCLAPESTALTTVHPACWHEPVQHGQRRSEEVRLP